MSSVGVIIQLPSAAAQPASSSAESPMAMPLSLLIQKQPPHKSDRRCVDFEESDGDSDLLDALDAIEESLARKKRTTAISFDSDDVSGPGTLTVRAMQCEKLSLASDCGKRCLTQTVTSC